MSNSTETKLGKGIIATHYDNFPTVELHDGQDTLYIPQKCWKKLIKVLEAAQAAHEANTATKQVPKESQ